MTRDAKRRKKKLREWWVRDCKHPTGWTTVQLHDTRQGAVKTANGCASCEIIHVREVLPAKRKAKR